MRMRKTNATFPLDSLDLYILAIGEPSPHTGTLENSVPTQKAIAPEVAPQQSL